VEFEGPSFVEGGNGVPTKVIMPSKLNDFNIQLPLNWLALVKITYMRFGNKKTHYFSINFCIL